MAEQRKKAKSSKGEAGGMRGEHAALRDTPIVADALVRKGFSFDPSWDRLFAAGYPHLALLTDEVVEDGKLDAVAIAVFNKAPYSIEWPSGLARPIARLLSRYSEAFVPGTADLSDFAKSTLRDSSAIGEQEALDLLLRQLSAGWIVDRSLKTTMFLLEASLGERATAAMVEAICRQPPDRFAEHGVELSNAIARLGLMLLRTSSTLRDDLVRRLEQLFGKVCPKPFAATDDRSLPLHALDYVLHGVEGARRAFPRGIGIGQLPFLDVPQALALEAVRAAASVGPLASPPDVRRVFLAGAEALEVEAQWVAAYTKVVTKAPEIMLETYGQVNDARTVSLVLDLGKRKPLAKAVAAWFQAHADLARPELERIAAKDPGRSSDATAALAKL